MKAYNEERLKNYIKVGYGVISIPEEKEKLVKLFKLPEEIIDYEITLNEYQANRLIEIWYNLGESRIITKHKFDEAFTEIENYINLCIIALRFRSMKAYKNYLKRYHNDTI